MPIIVKETLPCQECKGLCCGPVPVTEQEFKKIRKKIKSMPQKRRLDLEKQPRYYGTCIFFDQDHNQCCIYTVRPKVCQLFGYYKELACFRKPELAKGEKLDIPEMPYGIISADITWQDFK